MVFTIAPQAGRRQGQYVEVQKLQCSALQQCLLYYAQTARGFNARLEATAAKILHPICIHYFICTKGSIYVFETSIGNEYYALSNLLEDCNLYLQC